MRRIKQGNNVEKKKENGDKKERIMKWAVMETRSVTTRSEAARHGQKDRRPGRQADYRSL